MCHTPVSQFGFGIGLLATRKAVDVYRGDAVANFTTCRGRNDTAWEVADSDVVDAA